MKYITKTIIYTFRKVSLYSYFIRLFFVDSAPTIVAHVVLEAQGFKQLILGTAVNIIVGTTNTALPASGVVSPGIGTATNASSRAVFTRAATFRRALSTALVGHELRPSTLMY